LSIGVPTAAGRPDDEDIARRQLDARDASEDAHAALGQAVCRIARHQPVFVDRRDIDEAATCRSSCRSSLTARRLLAEDGSR
jgi:hypothetical protein